MPNISPSFQVQNPPQSFFSKLRFLGPGFILSASIVGSGELIATTILGAKGGFITFWVILVSCFIKVAIQLEYGKNSILSGNSLMAEFNQFGGPKLKKANWSVWTTFFLTGLKILQLGGMLGGAAIALSLIFPSISVSFGALLIGISLILFFLKNYYPLIEKSATLMVFGFTLFTLISLIAIFYTPYALTWEQVASGLTFNLPNELIFVAIGAFGITGVASDEIIAYTYWCQEKGYASFVGEYDGSEEWKSRAKGWIKIMQMDAFLAMLIYTLVTAAFYLLGASILHGNQEIPEGMDLINSLASIYTESLGPNARTGYLIGGFFALYSSVFATLAYWTRLFPDALSQIGWIAEENEKKKAVKIMSFLFPLFWVIAFLFIKQPGFMVLFGGVIGSVLLLLVVYGALKFYFKNRKLNLAQNGLYGIIFWLSVLSIVSVSFYGVYKLF
ncbi:Nramp family divalent metal transporter [Algoriphagus sp. CAU 1675]|uniref:Nramp family divalent metal transporter n=1 Tax=Algoriphagus sp. CAU 1675 TaxID=3032597 RepID=UPI0023DC9766|nr:Nramp family divalent metal transporter [Algoriphagus sp. CAU 1675]MDF2157921.1 Nramp family divalent metal transporter [Algoriphagus sp. CAU 1675]